MSGYASIQFVGLDGDTGRAEVIGKEEGTRGLKRGYIDSGFAISTRVVDQASGVGS